MKKVLYLAFILLVCTYAVAQPTFILQPATGPQFSRGWNTRNYNSVNHCIVDYMAVDQSCGQPFSNMLTCYNPTTNTSTILYQSGGGLRVNGVCTNPVTQNDAPGIMGDRHPTRQIACSNLGCIVTGGTQETYKYKDTLFFSFSDGSITSLPDQPFGPHMEGSLTYDSGTNRYMLFGGTTNGATSPNTWEFDPVMNNWLTVASSGPPQRLRQGQVYLNGFHYMFGGKQGTTILGDFFKYDSTVKQWTKINATGQIPPPMVFAPMAADTLRNLVWLYAGPNTLYYYDPVANNWTLSSVTGGPSIVSPYNNSYNLAYYPDSDTLSLTWPVTNSGPQSYYNASLVGYLINKQKSPAPLRGIEDQLRTLHLRGIK